MWPIYLLFNKILKTGDERELKGDHLNAYLFQKPSSSIDSHSPSLCRSHLLEVPHVNQIYTWDCGLACVLMVLKTIGVNNYDIQALAELCSTTSIWTVDLAYLLQRFSVAFSYFTVTFGANPNYCVESFYKEELPNDLVRVDLLFQKAMEAGIDIQCRSFSAEEISILVLSGKYIAIALVDHSKLSHVGQEGSPVPGVFGDNPGYTGHYVLICGYDAGADMFEIRDPASSKKHKRISSKSLEEARKAFGTDEDLLLYGGVRGMVPAGYEPEIYSDSALSFSVKPTAQSIWQVWGIRLSSFEQEICLEKSNNRHQPSLQLSSDVNNDS